MEMVPIQLLSVKTVVILRTECRALWKHGRLLRRSHQVLSEGCVLQGWKGRKQFQIGWRAALYQEGVSASWKRCLVRFQCHEILCMAYPKLFESHLQ